MPSLKTHFELISVDVVKKIAKELPEDDPIEHDEMVHAPDEDRPPQERWREVAQRVHEEQDPQKMIGLVRQLIAAIDEDQHRKYETFTDRTILDAKGK